MLEEFQELFDFNEDGELDSLEKTAEASFIDRISVVDRIENDIFCDVEIKD